MESTVFYNNNSCSKEKQIIKDGYGNQVGTTELGEGCELTYRENISIHRGGVLGFVSGVEFKEGDEILFRQGANEYTLRTQVKRVIETREVTERYYPVFKKTPIFYTLLELN